MRVSFGSSQAVHAAVSDHTWQVVMYRQKVGDHNFGPVHASLKQMKLRSKSDPKPSLVEMICNQPSDLDAQTVVEAAHVALLEKMPR